jgi:hypothetical protein
MRSAGYVAVDKLWTEGFGNHNIHTPSLRSPARPVRCVFSRLNTHIYSPVKGAEAVFVKYFFG